METGVGVGVEHMKHAVMLRKAVELRVSSHLQLACTEVHLSGRMDLSGQWKVWIWQTK